MVISLSEKYLLPTSPSQYYCSSNYVLPVGSVYVLVLISDRQRDLPLKHEQQKLQKLAQLIVASENRSCDEVAIHFITAALMCRMHKQFFQDPSLTDCISFPMDKEVQAGFCYLGDVFVCPKQALDYAEENGLDPYRETTLYVVHGLLHLLGYDDLDSTEKTQMRRQEQKYMKMLDKAGLILCQK